MLNRYRCLRFAEQPLGGKSRMEPYEPSNSTKPVYTTPTMYYRTGTVDHGSEITLTDGGYYERIENGIPQLAGGDGYTGFQQSNTPKVCASTTPASSLFAAAHNNTAGEYHIYRTEKEPDITLTNAPFDFSLLNEVRYNNPSDNPVTFTHYQTVTLPNEAITDIGLTYIPPGLPYIHEWGDAVQTVLSETVLAGNDYPQDITSRIDIERPNRKAYEQQPGAFI